MPTPRQTSLAAVPAYRQGRAAPEGASKLSSNESPHTPLPSVQQALANELDQIHFYPDMSVSRVRTPLASYLGVPEESLTFGAGSVEVASQLIHATAGYGDEVMFAWRSFEAYPALISVAGATPVAVPLDAELRHDLDAMLAAITPQTRLIFICNPNNPTGTVVEAEALRKFVDAVPRDVVVVIDEAYVHYDRTPNRANGIELFHEFPHVTVLHTFSKAYRLAGLRIGYAVAHPELIENLGKVAVPFGVTNLAQVAAVASIEAEAELKDRIDGVVIDRDRVFEALAGWGYSPAPTQGNFVWIPATNSLGLSPADIAERLEAGNVIARVFPEDGVRISAGSPLDADRVLAALNPEKAL